MIASHCDHPLTSRDAGGACRECLPEKRNRRTNWRPHRPGDVVHKVTNYSSMAHCGATERDGARFTSKLRMVTCVPCRERTIALRAAAKARMARELGQ